MSTSRALTKSVLLLRQEALDLEPPLQKDVGGEPGRRNSPRLQNRRRLQQQYRQHLRFSGNGRAVRLTTTRFALDSSVWKDLCRLSSQRRAQ